MSASAGQRSQASSEKSKKDQGSKKSGKASSAAPTAQDSSNTKHSESLTHQVDVHQPAVATPIVDTPPGETQIAGGTPVVAPITDASSAPGSTSQETGDPTDVTKEHLVEPTTGEDRTGDDEKPSDKEEPDVNALRPKKKSKPIEEESSDDSSSESSTSESESSSDEEDSLDQAHRPQGKRRAIPQPLSFSRSNVERLTTMIVDIVGQLLDKRDADERKRKLARKAAAASKKEKKNDEKRRALATATLNAELEMSESSENDQTSIVTSDDVQPHSAPSTEDLAMPSATIGTGIAAAAKPKPQIATSIPKPAPASAPNATAAIDPNVTHTIATETTEVATPIDHQKTAVMHPGTVEPPIPGYAQLMSHYRPGIFGNPFTPPGTPIPFTQPQGPWAPFQMLPPGSFNDKNYAHLQHTAANTPTALIIPPLLMVPDEEEKKKLTNSLISYTDFKAAIEPHLPKHIGNEDQLLIALARAWSYGLDNLIDPMTLRLLIVSVFKGHVQSNPSLQCGYAILLSWARALKNSRSQDFFHRILMSMPPCKEAETREIEFAYYIEMSDLRAFNCRRTVEEAQRMVPSLKTQFLLITSRLSPSTSYSLDQLNIAMAGVLDRMVLKLERKPEPMVLANRILRKAADYASKEAKRIAQSQHPLFPRATVAHSDSHNSHRRSNNHSRRNNNFASSAPPAAPIDASTPIAAPPAASSSTPTLSNRRTQRHSAMTDEEFTAIGYCLTCRWVGNLMPAERAHNKDACPNKERARLQKEAFLLRKNANHAPAQGKA